MTGSDNFNINISTKPVNINIKELQGSYNQIDPFRAQLQEFNKKFGKLLNDVGLSVNELDAFEIRLTANSEPVPYVEYRNNIIKSQSSKLLKVLTDYLQKIENGWIKPYSTRMSDWHKIASDYKVNKKNYTKDSTPRKILFDPFEKAEKKTTDIAAALVKVTPAESRDTAKTVKGTGNTSPADDQNNKTVFKYTDRLCLNRLIEWGYLEKDVLGEKA